MAKKSKIPGKEEPVKPVEGEILVPYDTGGLVDFVLVCYVAGILLMVYMIIGGIFQYVL